MYHETFLSIGKIENGFLIEVRVPYKPSKSGGSLHHEEPKQFYVKDAVEVGTKVAELLPKLVDKVDADEQFAVAFEEAQDE